MPFATNWLDQMSVVWIRALSGLQNVPVGNQCELKVMEGEEQPEHLEGLKHAICASQSLDPQAIEPSWSLKHIAVHRQSLPAPRTFPANYL